MNISTHFNFNMDTPDGKDPDRYSPTLRAYHKKLWSRVLPDGTYFNLIDNFPDYYLSHKSDHGFFELSSDAITNTYLHTKRLSRIAEQLSEESRKAFFDACSTIGGYILFPARKVDRKPTINGARGISSQVGDRFDLTLECIRRHYARESHPLEDCLNRYSSFFELFETFRSYVAYFDLQDLIDEETGDIKFYLPFDSFQSSPYPATIEDYADYRARTLDFVRARNLRISRRMVEAAA